MKSPHRTATRFREARERAGLSIAETAIRVGLAAASVWDLETHDDELTSVYSAVDLQRFAAAFSVAPIGLIGGEAREAAITVNDLAAAIREHCETRGITLEEFGVVAGWDLRGAVDAPQKLLSDVSLDGIRDICHELNIDWMGIIRGLADGASPRDE